MPTKNTKRAPKHTTDAHHHQHIRLKRGATSNSTLIDKLVYIAGPLTPIAIAPTAYAVWFGDGAEGIAIITWIILTGTSFVMASYALAHGAKPLILTYIPLFMLNVAVVVGVLVKT